MSKWSLISAQIFRTGYSLGGCDHLGELLVDGDPSVLRKGVHGRIETPVDHNSGAISYILRDRRRTSVEGGPIGRDDT